MHTITTAPAGHIFEHEEFENPAVRFVYEFYSGGASAPLHSSRDQELAAMQGYAKHYKMEISAEDFDWGIALRFGDGCEYEWPR